KRLNRARERLVRLAKKLGVSLRQSYRRVGKLALIKHQRYAHAHQFKRAHRSLRKLKTYLGRVIRDITSGQNRRVTPQIKREFKRRAAIEPVIFAHASGDAINAVLAAAGYNFRRLLAWLRFLWLRILIALGLAAQLKLA